MDKELTDDWADWIRLNIERGCDKDGIFRILLDSGFAHDQIVAEMNYEPTADLDLVTNPLTWRRPADHDEFSQQIFLGEEQLCLPGAQRIPTDLAEVYLMDDFLSQQECERLTALIKSRLGPSAIGGPAGEVIANSYHASSTCNLNNVYNPLVRDIDDRICRTIGIDASYSEGIQGHYYPAGEEFKAPTDYFEQSADFRGQRTYTSMVYLNDVEEGGETDFVKLGFIIKPKCGRALIWNNLDARGIPNPYVMNHARPVVRGSQWIITQCFRANDVGPMYTKDRTEAFIDDLILTSALTAREAATLSKEEFDVLRAHIRTELFYSGQVRQLLTERAKKTLKDLREQSSVVGLAPLTGPSMGMDATEITDVRFVLVAHARTGSNLLSSALQQHPRVVMLGELFHDNPQDCLTNYYSSSTYSGGDGAEFLDRLYRGYDRQGSAVGFKIQYGQASVHAGAQAAWRFLIGHTEIRVIRLERANLMAAYTSLKTAMQTGEWVRTAGGPATNETVTLRLDPTECLGYFQMIERYTQRARTAFRNHHVLHLMYEHDLCESFEVSLRRVQEFLGVSNFPITPRTQKQSDSELSEQIENFAELADYFADSPYANYFTMR
jgi:LPS sulfotransferase NodH